MKTLYSCAIWCSLSLIFVSCSSTPTGSSDKGLKLYFTQNQELEFEPCGCSMAPRGGLVREYGYIQKHGKPEAFFAFGRTFSAEAPNSKNLPTQLLKAEFLAQGLKAVGVTHLSPGAEDLVLGKANLEKLAQGFEFFSTNIVDKATGAPIFSPSANLTYKGQKILILGFADPKIAVPNDLKVLPIGESLEANLRTLKDKTDFLIVLAPLSAKEKDALHAKIPNIPTLIVGTDVEPAMGSVEQLSPFLVSAQSRFRSQEIVSTSLELTGGAKAIFADSVSRQALTHQSFTQLSIKEEEAALKTEKNLKKKKALENSLLEHTNMLARSKGIPAKAGKDTDLVHTTVTGLYPDYEVKETVVSPIIGAMKEKIRENALQSKP